MDQELLKSLDSIETSINLIKDEVKSNQTSFKAATEQIVALGKAQEKLSLELLELKQENATPKLNNIVIKSIGEQASALDIVKNYRENKGGSVTFEIKKATVTSPANNTATRSTISPAFQAGMVLEAEQPLELEALFPHIPVSVDAIEYLKEGSIVTNAQVKTEGEKLAEATVTKPEIKTANCVNIGSFVTITEQLLTNEPAFAAYIDQKLQYKLQLEIERQLINGTGGSTELSGLLNTSNFTDVTATVQGKLPTTGKQLFDFALLAKTELTKTFYTPEAWLLNPDDWAKLCLLKDTKGNYILGGPQALSSKMLWGTRVITSSHIPVGKYVLGNYKMGATIYDRQALTFKISDQDGENFKSMLYTLRVNRRLGFAVENPKAILGGDFSLGGE